MILAIVLSALVRFPITPALPVVGATTQHTESDDKKPPNRGDGR